MKFPLRKSENDVVIISEKGNVIIYNSILNNPLYFDNKSYIFFEASSTINEEDYLNANSDVKEVIESMVDAYLFLEPGVDEYTICKCINNEYLKAFEQGKTIKWIDLHVSDACNFGCPHCIAGNDKKNLLMTFNESKELLDSYIAFIKKHNNDLHTLNIHFGSCEPLLNFSVIKNTCIYLNNFYPEYTLNMMLNTNLSLLTKEMADFFRDYNIEICTSLDGTKVYNDRIRTYPDGIGTYDDIISAMQIMHDAGTPIDGISITLTEKNYEGIQDLLDWCIKHRMKSLAIDFDLIHSTNISVEEKARFIIETYNKLKDNGIEFHGTWMTPFLNLCNCTNASNTVTFCRSNAGENCSVDAKGNISVCAYSDKIIGNMNSLEVDIKPGGSYYKYVSDHLIGNVNNKKCIGCELEGSCVGQCQISQDELIQEHFDEQCDYFRLVTKYMLQNLADEVVLE